MPQQSRKRGRIVLLAAAALSLPCLTSAQTTDWTNAAGDGRWSDVGNWDNGVPGANYTANVTSTLGLTQTITYDYPSFPPTLSELNVNLTGGTGGASEILAMAANKITAENECAGGYFGSPTGGVGAITQSGGTNTCDDNLYLGYNTGDQGSYTLSNGSFADNGGLGAYEYIGYYGVGNFNQTGGTNTANCAFRLGFLYGSSGVYTLSGGLLTNPSQDGEAIGDRGVGIFNQTGGTNDVPSILSLANFPGATGYYSLSGTGTLSAYELSVAPNGIATFNQSGGTDSVPGSSPLYIGGVGATGSYILSGGSLSSTGGDAVGYGGTGYFIQSGGTNTIGSATGLAVASQTNSVGTYTLSGGSAILNGDAYVGGSSSGAGGTGVLTVSGGLFSLGTTGTLTVFNTSGTALNLSGGMITTGALNLSGNSALFNWTGGALSLTNSDLTIGAGGLLGPTLTVGSAQSLGVTGSGNTLSIASTGTLNLAGGTINAATLANSGQFNWTAGTLNLTHSNLTIGSGGILGPALTLTGGQELGVTGLDRTVTVTNTGEINLNGGTIIASSLNLSGVVEQSGGMNILGTVGILDVGANTGSTGTYQLSGSGSLSAAPPFATEFIGVNGMGFFDQNGGTNLAGLLRIGANGGAGSYSLTGGTLNVTGALTIGTLGALTISSTTATVGSASNLGDVSLTDPIGAISAGDLLVTGSFTQSSTGELDVALGGLLAGSQYSVLDVERAVSLAGTLDVSLANGFVPSHGDFFEVIDAGSVTGTFSNVILPDAQTYSVVYTPTGVFIALPEPGSAALLAAGTIGLLVRRRERMKAAK